ncbi:hypothetical protein AMATHDRAFT_3310 [Amanita thiersii Skay4041]|uniref:Heme haloperoxidase family profile domain-containing protein n=1 Tax=Amanita thiersii Skay4041 TaxID=703135 RepID=A0A2A9NKU4_9AGAR|nr:hypothetical protein AMATHDRAFT_3310 [Amanita thiersii Skay4041]
MSPITFIADAILYACVFIWDAGIAFMNIITPKRKSGHIISNHEPGSEGEWPKYMPPTETDSRSACPALNALANHGILPRDGRNISFPELNHAIRVTYNLAPSFSYLLPKFGARVLNKRYSKDKVDLADFNLHNGIEHDASLTRDDSIQQVDQGKPSLSLVKGLLSSATGNDKDGDVILTAKDIARYSSKRRQDSMASNKSYSLSFLHKIFGSANSSLLLTVFGGVTSDLEPFLIEERLLDGWETQRRERFGHTLFSLNKTTHSIEAGIKVDDKAK